MDYLRDSVRKYLDKPPEMKIKTNSLVKDFKTSSSAFREAYAVAEVRLVEGDRSVMEDVWSLLVKESERLPLGEEAVRRWQLAVEALLPYAINLYLAPNRPEFKHVKVGTVPDIE